MNKTTRSANPPPYPADIATTSFRAWGFTLYVIHPYSFSIRRFPQGFRKFLKSRMNNRPKSAR